MYTAETRQELNKNYRLVPDPNGPIEIYRKFWQAKYNNSVTVPPELVYADLINSNFKRCRETAQMIYDEQIKDRFVKGEV